MKWLNASTHRVCGAQVHPTSPATPLVFAMNRGPPARSSYAYTNKVIRQLATPTPSGMHSPGTR